MSWETCVDKEGFLHWIACQYWQPRTVRFTPSTRGGSDDEHERSQDREDGGYRQHIHSHHQHYHVYDHHG